MLHNDSHANVLHIQSELKQKEKKSNNFNYSLYEVGVSGVLVISTYP